ncbi:MAG: CDP-archaeol synthase [Gammaproteobacteria bacterium]|nr:CDP-archaeol synthase [Gammaproteobacteria bacterium]
MREVTIVLLLIIIANGAPILIRYILGDRLTFPVDCFRNFFDGKRLFGDSKTWIGLFSIPAFSIAAAWLLGLGMETGMLAGAGVMAGDLFSSFIKRRLGMKVSSMALGLDQIPESLFPLLLLRNTMNYGMLEIVIGVVSFIIIELLISQLLYWLHIRKQPY